MAEEACPLCDGWSSPETQEQLSTDSAAPSAEPRSESREEVAEEIASLEDVAPDTDGGPENHEAERLWSMPAELEVAAAGDSTAERPENSAHELVQRMLASEHPALSGASSVAMVMLSAGPMSFAVLVPMPARPKLTEDAVAQMGTTWTHGISEELPSLAAAVRTTCVDGAHAPAHECCRICLQPFEEGDKLTALPCTNRGCGSVWHLSCIHDWLNQGSNPTCPLCRDQVHVEDDQSQTPGCPSPFALLGSSGDDGEPGLPPDMMGFLLRSLLSQSTSPLEAPSAPRMAA